MRLFIFLFSLILSFPVFADEIPVATPTQYIDETETVSDEVIEDTPYISDETSDLQVVEDEMLNALSDEELEILDPEYLVDDSVSDWSFAEFIKVTIANSLTELFFEDDAQEEEDPDPDQPVNIDSLDSDTLIPDIHFNLLSAPLLRSSGSTTSYKNVVIFTGTLGGTECELVIPYSSYASLCVIDGKLVNVGGSTVTGRLLYDGALIDPSEYDTYSYILNPVYGSTSSVYNYGSFNYRRHFYEYTGGYNPSIRYDDSYGDFTVTDTDIYFSASEREYYLLLVILLFMGVNWLWSRRH